MSYLKKYMAKKGMKMDEVPEHDYVEAVAESPIHDYECAPGAEEAEEEDPIRGPKGPAKKGYK